MFRFTHLLITTAAIILVAGTYVLTISSVIWNFMALPLLLCGLGLIMAFCEYQDAKFSKQSAEVHCLLQYLINNKPSTKFKDVA
ncbi:hypothetical protein [Pleionea sediminis]|uniref:hypothetical protein n=1 Tax=Pleionea sediminis TaxID=2569479 RepID=UPI001184849C|nr:hypothetical protein [Pleionea sediminis]